MSEMQIPEFLRRTPTPTGDKTVTAPTPPTKTRTARRDAYIARISISIPINPADKDSYSNAVDAIDGLAAELPKDAIVTFTHRGLGKL